MRTFLATLTLFSLSTAVWSQAASPTSPTISHSLIPQAGSLVVFTPPRAAGRELVEAEALVATSLTTRLGAMGYRVATLSKENFNGLWEHEVKAVGGIFDPTTGQPRLDAYAMAIAMVATLVIEQTGAKLVIFPQVVVRSAEFSGSNAWWDGQTRHVPTRGLGADTARFGGSTSAMSVELLAINSEGKVAFRTRGGASLLLQANFSSSRNEIRKDLFENGREIDEGVAIALEPLTSKTMQANPAPRQ